MANPTYPTRSEIAHFFKEMTRSGDRNALFDRFDPNVDFTVMGTSPMSKQYTSLQSFAEGTFHRLQPLLQHPPLKLEVVNVMGGGEHEWASVEMKAKNTMKNGLDYTMTYNWVLRFNEAGKIVQARAYLDTELLTQALRENECPSQRVDVEY